MRCTVLAQRPCFYAAHRTCRLACECTPVYNSKKCSIIFHRIFTMETPSRTAALRCAMEKYSGSKSRLLLRVYRCLQVFVDEDYILDSSKGVLMNKKWLLRATGSTTRNEVEANKVAILDVAEVGKFVGWVNRLCVDFPGSAEEHYVYWSSINKRNIYMVNIAALMTGAKLYDRSSEATSTTEIVDSLLGAMKRFNRDTTRAAASGLANGITKFYGVILKCGEDAVFNSKVSVRLFRNMTKLACTDIIRRIKGLGDQHMELFFNDLLDGHPLKPMLQHARQLVQKHRALLRMMPASSNAFRSSGFPPRDISPKQDETSSEYSDDGSAHQFGGDSDYRPDAGDTGKEESEKNLSDCGTNDGYGDAGSADDTEKGDDGSDSSTETPISGQEAPSVVPQFMQRSHKRVRLGAVTRDGRRLAQRVPLTRSQSLQSEAVLF